MSSIVILTNAGTNNWTVPSDWNNSSNTVEVLGAGGNGSTTANRAGGGGGGYAKSSNLTFTPSSSVSYTIATGGSGATTSLTGGPSATAGGNASGSTGGTPGTGTGTTATFTGGTGASNAGTNSGGSGGGGAAGPNGNGVNGGSSSAGATGVGGAGDNGTGGGGGTQGTSGGNGTNGGNGSEFSPFGCGGGGGGGGNGGGNGGNGGNGTGLGAGGGGMGSGGSTAGTGSQGIIYITYNSTADRYWVGGSGTWNNSNTPWSTTSGGSGGADAPNSVTNHVIFDANSGGGTVTLGIDFTGVNVDFTGFTGTFAQGTHTLSLLGSLTMGAVTTWTGSGADSIGGNLSLGSGMTNSYTGNITFNSTSSGKTITSNGVSIGSNVTFNGSGGVWTMQDSSNIKTVTLTAGTLVAGSTTLSLSGTGTVWNANGGSFTANSSTVKLTNTSSSSKTFAGGGLTYATFYITGSGTGAYTISGSNTFTFFICDTPPHTINFTAGTTQTVSNFTVSGTAGNLMTFQSTISGSPWFLIKSPSGTVTCDYLSLQDSHAS